MKKLLVICILCVLFLLPLTSKSLESSTIEKIGERFHECIYECVVKFDLMMMDDTIYFLGDEIPQEALECLNDCVTEYEKEVDKLIEDQSNDTSNLGDKNVLAI